MKHAREQRKKRYMIGLLFFVFVFFAPKEVSATETKDEMTALLEEMDFTQIDAFMEDYSENEVSFSELVMQLLSDGISEDLVKLVFDQIKSLLLKELETNRKMLTEVMLLLFCFSVLKNFAGVFESSYLSDLCFLLVYCVLAVMLLKTFISLQSIAKSALGNCVDFMRVLVPTFCFSMIFTSNGNSFMGFYQMAFLVIYLVEWLFLTILMPMIQVYVLMEVLGHFVPEERFSNLTELFYGLIGWGMKTAAVLVFGLNVVQNLIYPAKAQIGQGIFSKAASAIPGIGNAVSSVAQLLMGCGMVIKNCVGAAGLLALFLIGVVPFVKMVCLCAFYKIAAAVTEPVTDKRIAACLKGMANGGILYVRLLGYCIMLFFVTIALAATMSGVTV